MLSQHGFDFLEFNAEAANLNLMIDPPEVLNGAVRKKACEITGAIDAIAGSKRIIQKLLCRQLRAIVVTACDSDTSDEQFARDENRRGFQSVIQNIHLCVRDRFADRNEAQFRIAIAFPVGHLDRGFGWAVEVQELAVEQTIELLLSFDRKRFAAADDFLDRLAGCGGRFVQEGLQHGRNEMNRGDLLVLDELCQVSRIFVSFRARDDERCPGDQRPEKFPGRNIEAEWRFLKELVARTDRIFVLSPEQAVTNTAMAVQCALRFAGRT